MSSRRVEDLHLDGLNKLISESGLECIRSAPESMESFSLSGEGEEQGLLEEEIEATPEAKQEEEEKPKSVEEAEEEQTALFPTPSLRRVLPERIRNIEQQNRIHVLPEEFRTDIDPQAIPRIASTAQQKYIEILGEIVGCTEYKNSLAEYWFLDTLANLLWRAQDDELDRPTQAILIQWFCEWMKEMQYFDAANRERMLKRFQDNMMAAARYVGDEERLPTPLEACVHYKELEPDEFSAINSIAQASRMAGNTMETQPSRMTTQPNRMGTQPSRMAPLQPTMSKHLVTFESNSYQCSLRDLSKIIHYIYDLFSTDYQYDLVRSVFTFGPDYVLIDAPYQMQQPKRMYVPMKFKPKKEPKSPKEPKPKKGKKPEVWTEDYIALMQLRLQDIKQHEEEGDRDKEAYNRRSHILPLGLAATDAFFDQYWPPPPPEPEPEPVVEAVKKKKGGRK